MGIGTLADRYGRKRLFIISLACCGLTSLGCGVAPDIPLLIVLRFLQGMSGGVMLICLLAVLSALLLRETASEASDAGRCAEYR